MPNIDKQGKQKVIKRKREREIGREVGKEIYKMMGGNNNRDV